MVIILGAVVLIVTTFIGTFLLGEFWKAHSLSGEIERAKNFLKSYDASYAQAVELAAENYQVSNQMIEKNLDRIQEVLRQKQELLRSVQDFGCVAMVHPEARSYVRTLLWQLQFGDLFATSQTWSKELDDRILLIQEYFARVKTNLRAQK